MRPEIVRGTDSADDSPMSGGARRLQGRRELASRMIWFFGAIVVAHLPFWLLSQVYALERPQLNVELFVAAAVCAWRPAAGLPLLLLVWGVDGLVSQSVTYRFATSIAFMASVRFAGELDWTELLSTGSLVGAALFLAAFFGSWWMARRRRPEWRLTIASLVVVLVLDALNGSSRFAFIDRRLLAVNLAGAPSLTLYAQFRAAQLHQPPTVLGVEESVSTSLGLRGWARSHPDRSIWLVLVESMGRLQDAGLRQYALDAMAQATQGGNYRLESARMPFKGATTSGELRALCGLAGNYADLTPAEGAACLPADLARMGWSTTGMHGFSGRMFDRRAWWPTIGLQQLLFGRDLGDLKTCGGAFKGVCDADLLGAAARRVAQPRQFVYSLTLNTHLPLDPVAVPPDLRRICRQAGVTESVCALTAAHAAVLKTIGKLAAEMPNHRPLVVVLGDHAPPFVDARSRSAFDNDIVPVFVLWPSPS